MKLADTDCFSEIFEFQKLLKEVPYKIISFQNDLVESALKKANSMLPDIEVYCYVKKYDEAPLEPKDCYVEDPDKELTDEQRNGIFEAEVTESQDNSGMVEEDKPQESNGEFEEEEIPPESSESEANNDEEQEKRNNDTGHGQKENDSGSSQENHGNEASIKNEAQNDNRGQEGKGNLDILALLKPNLENKH